MYIYCRIQWISLISYSNKALNQNEFPGLVFECYGTPNCQSTGEQVIDQFGLGSPNGIWTNVAINIAFAVAYIIIGYAFFRKTSKPLLRLE